MATVTGLTAARMLEIEAASVVNGEVVGGNLILEKFDGTTINAGPVQGTAGAPGAQGPPGPPGTSIGGSIPGEVKLWSGAVLPASTYGTWVWADGGVYSVAAHPIAAGHIGAQWRTFGGASDPGAGNFRVPDMRGLTPVGLDAMPGGARANRMTRSIAIVLAGAAGQEVHYISVAELPAHAHPITDVQHSHPLTESAQHAHGEVVKFGTDVDLAQGQGGLSFDDNYGNTDYQFAGISGTDPQYTGINGTGNNGDGNAHENVQPSVFVPYIVCLDG